MLSAENVAALTAAQRELWFSPVLPTAVFELLSPSNKTRKGKNRLKLLLDDCARSAVPLVVLLDKSTRSAIVKRPGHDDVAITPAETLTFDELPGLELDVAAVFAASD